VDIFNFFTVPRRFSSFFPNAVYKRRILNPAWGVKLTGTLGGTAFGFIPAGDDWPGQSWEVGENPNEGKQAFWGIARGKYSLGKDNYIGILYSGRDFAGQYNHVFGGDTFFRLFNTHRFNVSFLHSISSGYNSNAPGLKSSNFNFLYDICPKS
jgi:hypothetical protein